jgi:hypothetical protein
MKYLFRVNGLAAIVDGGRSFIAFWLDFDLKFSIKNMFPEDHLFNARFV